MALSGSISGSIKDGKYTLRIDWSATQSIANNTSKITATMYLVQASSWGLDIGTRSDNKTTIAGTSYTWSSPAINNSGGKTTKLATVTSGNISHNADGTKKVTISATYYVRANISGTQYTSITASAEVTLDTIARATTPTLSASSVNMGSAVTINTPRASSSFTHDLAYSFAGGSYVSIANDVGTSYSWPTPDLASSIPNASSGTVTIRCITKNGGTTIGTKTVTMTLKVPTSAAYQPTISRITLAEATSGLADQFGAYIQGKSTLNVTISAAGAKGSTIKNYKTTLQGKTYTAASFTSGVLATSGTIRMDTTVTDSRGRTATKTELIYVLAYTAPKITALHAYRCKADGTPADDGTAMTVRYEYTAPSLNGGNTVATVLETKLATAAEYTADPVYRGSGLEGNASMLITSPVFSADYQYSVRLTASDWFGASSVYVTVLPSGAVILDIKADGTGIGFGQTADRAGAIFGWDPKGKVLGLGAATLELPEGANLNEYTQPGVYATGGNANVETFSNAPTTYGGTLRVYNALGRAAHSGAWVYMMQEYRPYLSAEPTYRRLLQTGEDGSWSPGAWVAGDKQTPASLGLGGTVLWEGSRYMTEGHTNQLAAPISDQPNGIVLVWSPYANGAAEDSNLMSFFVSKKLVALKPGLGHEFPLLRYLFGNVACKYLYIKNTEITGHASNSASGTASGIAYDNSKWVLRYVIGV